MPSFEIIKLSMRKYLEKAFFTTLMPLIVAVFVGIHITQTEHVSADILPQYVQGEVIVEISPNRKGDAAVVELLRTKASNIRAVKSFHREDLPDRESAYGPRMYTLKLGENEDVASVAEKLSQIPGVVSEPNYIGYATEVNDPYLPAQWGIEYSRFDEAYNIEMGENDITIAVIDSGVELTHPDLQNKLLPGYNFVDWNDDPSDDNGHGTKMAGIAAATTNNEIGIAGSCPECSLLPIRAGYDNGGLVTFSAGKVKWALAFAVGNPTGIEGIPHNPYLADVISMSLRFTNESTILHEGVEIASQAGAVLVASAGNSGSSSPVYPAGFPEVISVAASDDEGTLAGFSNYGDWVDVAAPGVNIMTTDLAGGYEYSTGTSPAAPFVAGLAGLMLSRSDQYDLSSEVIREILLSSSVPLAEGGIWGGNIDAKSSLLATPCAIKKKTLPYVQYGM
ncbi:MAG: S8 family serine peptidase [bacterium]|nr:S8 family serine peptidase [bacterium]